VSKQFLHISNNFVYTKSIIYNLPVTKTMDRNKLITFRVTAAKASSYKLACDNLGVSISFICRKALDETVNLSDKINSEKVKSGLKELVLPKNEPPHTQSTDQIPEVENVKKPFVSLGVTMSDD